jgi:cobalt-precorrin 5A hydrolase
MDGGEAVIVAGVGFSSKCEAAELAALVREAQAAAGLTVTALAVPAWTARAGCLAAAAQRLGTPIVAIGADELVSVADRVATQSPASQAAAGVGSVAEAAALAAAGPGARLALTRISSAHATCALAEGARP